MFKKISGKPIEHYVVSRLWHKINDENIEMVLQQYVMREEERYALVDISFPQINLFVEINEPPHYSSQDTIDDDKRRIKEIERQTRCNLYIFDCRKTLFKINQEIDKLASYIRTEVARRMVIGEFEPWDPDLKRNAEYWRYVGSISAERGVVLSTIQEICILFGADFSKIKRGYLRVGGIDHPKDRDLFLWWPSLKERSNWVNEISDDGITITERYIPRNNQKKILKPPSNPEKDRVVFVYRKDVYGIMGYGFIGVYRYDYDLSNKEKAAVWHRIRDSLDV